MNRITTSFLLASTLLVSAPTFAQTASGTMPSTAGATSSAGSFITEQPANEFRASKFIGLDVYGPDNQKIGDINEVLIDGSGAAKAAVIGVGGFLGIGEKNVAVPFSSLTWVNDRPATTTASSGMSGRTASTGAAPANSNVTGSTVPARSPAETAAYNGYPDHATVQLSKADLQNAPAFKYYADTHASSGSATNTSGPATTAPATTAPKM